MSKQILMKKMMALDFMCIDLALFLDTHPTDKKAIETFNAVAEEGKKVRCEYEREFGPVCMSQGGSNGNWNWVLDPWPWDADANFCMRGED